jgi:ribosomal protein S18 acetylase RimI-like enzyme
VAVLVRPGRAEDVEPAVAVWQVANTARRGGVPVPAEHEQRVRGYLAKPDAFLVVAQDGGDLIGMAVGFQGCEDDGAGPPIPGLCHISLVFVHPDRWRQGTGGMLMRHLLLEGRARGYSHFQLWTHADNRRAQQLYEGLGFLRSGREKDDDLGERTVQYALPGIDVRLAEALAPGLTDLMRRPAPLFEVRAEQWSDHPDQVTAMIRQPDGSGTGVSVMSGESEAARVVSAAEQLQEIVVEALWRQGQPATWPPCPTHPDGHPLKAVDHTTLGPSWVCPATGRPEFAIGSMGAYGGVSAD